MFKIILAWGLYFIKNLLFIFNSFKNFYFYRVHRNVKFVGARGLTVGENSLIGDSSWININDPSQGTLTIGNNCTIGMSNFITVGGNITIGDYFLSGINCAIISSSHVIENPSIPYLKTGTTSQNKINIGDNVFFGYGVSIVGNINIGNGSVIGACAVVTKSIPAYSIAIGNPARVVKKYSFMKKKWLSVDDYNEELETISGINITLDKDFYQPIAALRKNKNVY